MNKLDGNSDPSLESSSHFPPVIEEDPASKSEEAKKNEAVKKDKEAESSENIQDLAIHSVQKLSGSLPQISIPPIVHSPGFKETEEIVSLLPSLMKATSSSLEATSSSRPSDIYKIDWGKLGEIPPQDQAFIHFANSVMINGIISRKRAEILELIQVSSLDKNPRPENEVEVNAYKNQDGMRTSLYDPAKGSIPILLERKADKPPVKLTPWTEEQEKTILGSGSMAETVRKMFEQLQPFIFEEEKAADALIDLSSRAHTGMLLLMTPSSLQLRDNGQQPLNTEEMSNHSWIQETLKSESKCPEIKIDANIFPASFDVIALPRHFEQYQHFFVLKEKLVFVDSIQSTISYNFPPPSGFESRTNTQMDVPLSLPDFASQAIEYLKKKVEEEHKPYIFQHVAKGPLLSDEMYEKYWSQVTQDHYDKWVTARELK